MRVSLRPCDRRWTAGWAPLLAAAVYVALAAAVMALARVYDTSCVLCPFKQLTGLPCATCGTPRMALAFLTFHFADAWRLNPMLASALLIGAGCLALRYLGGRRVVIESSAPARWATVALLAVVVMANWVYLIVAGR
ncbi:MAG: DUF2752 domain-containing protein [Armatimonadota bacterium]|nr:MAG: DUF2752 domain-containing protein [Armatimonadota bacterium]